MTGNTIESPLDSLKPKIQRFVYEYSIDSCGTKAAIRAGYSPKTAQVQSSRLLSKVMVKTAVEHLKAEQIKKIQISVESIIAEIQEVIARCMQSVPVLDAQGQPVIITTQYGELAALYKFLPGHVLRGLELLGRHLGMFTDNLAVTEKRSLSHLTHEELEERLREVQKERRNL